MSGSTVAARTLVSSVGTSVASPSAPSRSLVAVTHGQAKRARRAAFALVALIATLCAHIVAVGAVHLTAGTLVSILAVTSLAAVVPPSPGAFSPRHPLRASAGLIVAQLVIHGAMVAAPAAFGLAMHGHVPLFTSLSLAVHIVIGLQLGLLLAFFDRLIARTVRVAIRLRTFLGAAPRPGKSLPYVRIPDLDVATSSSAPTACRGRGPPVLATA